MKSNMVDVASFIYKKMKNNIHILDIQMVKALNRKMTIAPKDAMFSHSVNAIANVATKLAGYKLFFDLNKPGADMDYKSKIKTDFGEYADDPYKGYSYNFDIWSNIHYGYIGASCDYSSLELLSGAGSAQVMALTVPPGYAGRVFKDIRNLEFLSAFDDPDDQNAIKLGINLWYRYKAGLMLDNLVASVRAEASALKTKRIPVFFDRINPRQKHPTGFA